MILTMMGTAMAALYSDAELEQLLGDLESDLVERKESLRGDAPVTVREAICAFANDLPNHRRAGVVFVGASIGVAKTRLVGEHADVPDRRGAWVPLYDRGEVIGAVLRSRVGVKPIYVSVGHRVSLERAVHWVMACTTRYRLPQTTRAAHGLDAEATQRTRSDGASAQWSEEG